jgi:hypothetical protein
MRKMMKDLGGFRGIYQTMKRSGYFSGHDDLDAPLGANRSIRAIRPLIFVLVFLNIAYAYDPWKHYEAHRL